MALAAVTALAMSLSLALFAVRGIGAFGTVASFGFLVTYLLLSIGVPLYLKRSGALRARDVATSAVSVVLLLVCVQGSLFPTPNWPMSLMSCVFLALVSAGLFHCSVLRARAPVELPSFEADLVASE